MLVAVLQQVDMLREYNSIILSCKVVHFLVVDTNAILWKCVNQLRGLYGLFDPPEANAPDPFSYKEYLTCMLLEYSLED